MTILSDFMAAGFRAMLEAAEAEHESGNLQQAEALHLLRHAIALMDKAGALPPADEGHRDIIRELKSINDRFVRLNASALAAPAGRQ